MASDFGPIEPVSGDRYALGKTTIPGNAPAGAEPFEGGRWILNGQVYAGPPPGAVPHDPQQGLYATTINGRTVDPSTGKPGPGLGTYKNPGVYDNAPGAIPISQTPTPTAGVPPTTVLGGPAALPPSQNPYQTQPSPTVPTTTATTGTFGSTQQTPYTSYLPSYNLGAFGGQGTTMPDAMQSQQTNPAGGLDQRSFYSLPQYGFYQ